MTTPSNEPLKLFYCYAHEDKDLRDELDVHLSLMKRQKLVTVWYDREILAGTNWEHEIDTHLGEAQIILLLVSARFLASDYCYGIEMQKALQRDKAGTARVIPIILRPVFWEDAPFSHLQILPAEAKPVTRWSDPNDAFEDVTRELYRVVKELRIALKTKISLKTKEEWLEEGNSLYTLERYEEALVAYEQAIYLDPNYAIAHYNKGNALDDLKRYEEALAAYNHAIHLVPDHADSYSNKGNTLFNLDKYKEALIAYDHAIQLRPSNLAYAYSGQGNALYALKHYEESLVAYDQAIHLDSNYAFAYYHKGLALQKLNRYPEAQAALSKAKQLGYP